MSLNAKKLYFVLCGVVLLFGAALFAVAYGADVFLRQRSNAVRESLIEVRSLERQQQDLQRTRQDIAKYKELSEIAAAIVPRDKDQTPTVREIANFADANNVVLGAITFPKSSLGAVGSTDAQLTAVPGISGTYTLTLTVRSDSNAKPLYQDFLRFIEALEQNRRTALVRSIVITPDTNNPGRVDFLLTIDEYIKP